MTRKDLADLGIESKDIIDAIMKMHGENIESNKAKISELEEKISNKENSIKELNDKIKSFDGKSEEIQSLQQKVLEYENAEKDRIFANNINEILGEKQFANEWTEKAIIEQVKAEVYKPENSGKGAKDIFESIIKDRTDIFKEDKEPQNQVIIPAAIGEQEAPKHEFKNFF